MNTLIRSVIIATAVLGAVQPAVACSYATFKIAGKAFVARSMEGPDFMLEQVITVPRGHEINGVSGPVGFVGIRHGDTEWVSSGLNEHGVNVESLALLESKFLPKGEGDINYLEVVTHVLANAKSVDEAVELLKKTKVETTTVAVAHDLEIGMHFAIRDNERSIVVEYIDGNGFPEIYENTVGAMTNDPRFPKQVEIAQAAIKSAAERSDDDLAVFNKFDSSAEGRFAHLATLNAEYKRHVKSGDGRDDGVTRAFSLLNSMEITPASMYWLWVSEQPQMIGYGTVSDIANRTYYFRTGDNPQIRKIELSKIDFSKIKYSAQSIIKQERSFLDMTPAQ